MNDMIGHLFMDISKDYVAKVTDKLQHLDIERHYLALYLLDRAESTLTQSELAEQLQVDKVSVVRLVDYLTDAGYVRRQVDQFDRRKQHVVLEDKADEIMPSIREAFKEADQTLLEVLDEKDRNDFLRISSRIREFYKDHSLSHIKMHVNFKRVKA